VCVIAAGAFMRFNNLYWDEGHYLHPDERLYVNTSVAQLPSSWAVFFSPKSPLNPHMFYYGALPLYIYNVILLILQRLNPLVNWSFLLVSRSVSATVSTLTIVFLFLAARRILQLKSAVIAVLLFGFAVGSIQYAHFNTTESILTFQAILMTYLSIVYIQTGSSARRRWVSAGLGILLGTAFASKITGLSFGLIPAAAFLIYLINNWSTGKRRNLILSLLADGIILTVLAVASGIIGSPYNLIDYPSFQREQSYMQGVTWGEFKPPFIIIYEFTKPYLYQLFQILPWILSPVTLAFSLIGWLVMWIRTSKNRPFFIILLWPTVYFLTTGIWYAKFARYMVPLLPFLCLYAAYLFEVLLEKSRIITSLLLAVCIVVQLSYTAGFVGSVYGHINTRVEASSWIYADIPAGSSIATEHWDDSLPLDVGGLTPAKFYHIELAVYEPDMPDKINTLLAQVNQSDYIILSSRRVYFSIEKNPQLYPFTSKFYRQLFAGNLGFVLAKKFTRYPQLFGITVDDDMADETFQSYDHPPVNIFRNISRLSPAELKIAVQNAK
jgi:hypothetical protein